MTCLRWQDERPFWYIIRIFNLVVLHMSCEIRVKLRRTNLNGGILASISSKANQAWNYHYTTMVNLNTSGYHLRKMLYPPASRPWYIRFQSRTNNPPPDILGSDASRIQNGRVPSRSAKPNTISRHVYTIYSK